MAAECPHKFPALPGQPGWVKSPSVIPPPAWKETTKNEPAVYGDYLNLLEGEWVNAEGEYGLHTTPLPSPGTNSETIPGKFHFVCEDYYEKLRFTKVDGSVRNRGGANEQFIAALKYETQIFRKTDGGLLHDENGMYLQMKPVFNRPATADTVEQDVGQPELAAGDGANGPYFVPKYTICRSGTIPHGSTISLLGGVSDVNDPKKSPPSFMKRGCDTWPSGRDLASAAERVHLAISQTMGGSFPFDLDKPAPAEITDPIWIVQDPSSNIAYTQRIIKHELYPYSVRPDLRLRDTLEGQKSPLKKFQVINLDSHPVADNEQDTGGPQGGVLNVPFVEKFCKVDRMRLNMWLVELEDGEMLLQYEQIVDFQFHFGTDGGATVWPHIQVNTLKKVGGKC